MSVKRPGYSRRDLPARQRREIAARLATFMTDTLKLTRRAFERRTGLPHATVAAWFAKGSAAPAVPDAAALVLLAETVQLNPAWLLLGDEPRVRGASVPSKSLAQGLRGLVVADLVGVMPKDDAERLVPAASTLLNAFLLQMSVLREVGRAGGEGQRQAPQPERGAAVTPASPTPMPERPAQAPRPTPPTAEPQPTGTFQKVVL